MLKIKDNICNITTFSVYKHTFPNGKVYIGITSRTPKIRWGNGKNYVNNKHMNNAIQKFGWDNIKHEVLFENLTKEQAEQKEIELISYYKSNTKDFGYNITNGGKHIGMFSEETIEKMRIAQKGKRLSKETKEKIRNAELGKTLSIETINKIKETKRINGFSELSRQKCSMTGKKVWKKNIKKAWDKTKKKVNKCNKNNEIIETYNSITEASIKNNISITNISYVCKNKRKTAGGYIWHFA